jgi:hypothetical protein
MTYFDPLLDLKEPVKPKWYQFWKVRSYRLQLLEYKKAKLSLALTSPEVIAAVKDLSIAMDTLRQVYKLEEEVIRFKEGTYESYIEGTENK